MTWTKLSDDFSDECWTLSDAAFRLHVEMLNYANRKLLDCRIPKDEMRLFAKRPEAVEELIRETYVRDLGDVYEIAFHSLYQPTREQVLAVRDRNAKNGRKGGRPKKNPSDNPVANPIGNPEGRDGTGRANYGDEVEEPEVVDYVWKTIDGKRQKVWLSAPADEQHLTTASSTGELLDPPQQETIPTPAVSNAASTSWPVVEIPNETCRICGQAVTSLDPWGLCSKVTPPHIAARKETPA